MYRYDVMTGGDAGGKYDNEQDALREFQERVAVGDGVSVWQIPLEGGEAHCIAIFPGNH
jgi:hypothetical protein